MLGRDKEGKLQIRGGAGGAPCLGGSFGLWASGGWIIVLLGILIFWFVGYASVVTMSFALLSTVIFSIRAWLGISPWVYAVYGLLAEILLVIALRPNIKRLLEGSERLHGYRRRLREKRAAETAKE
jgi:glycerol-3-phosphate acyltransferase PlsY